MNLASPPQIQIFFPHQTSAPVKSKKPLSDMRSCQSAASPWLVPTAGLPNNPISCSWDPAFSPTSPLQHARKGTERRQGQAVLGGYRVRVPEEKKLAGYSLEPLISIWSDYSLKEISPLPMAQGKLNCFCSLDKT